MLQIYCYGYDAQMFWSHLLLHLMWLLLVLQRMYVTFEAVHG